MPIYEYKCEEGHIFDTMQKMSDDPLSACIECGAPVKKLMQPVGISFKGSGFYSTDYSSGKANTASSSDSSSNGSSSGENSSSDNSSNGGSSEKSSGGRDSAKSASSASSSDS